jgi:hypothetical protein
LIANTNEQNIASECITGARGGNAARRVSEKIDDDALRFVVAVAVPDRVDHRLANRHANRIACVLVEAYAAGDVIADQLHEIELVERAREFQADDEVTTRHHTRLATVRDRFMMSSRVA